MNSGELLVLSPGQSLFVTGSGVYGANIPTTVHYALSTPSSFTEYSISTFLSGLSTIVLTGPSTGTYLVREISIFNKDTVTQVVTLGISDSTYTCTIRRYSLISGAVGTIGGVYHNGSLDTNLDLTSTLDLHSITEAHEGSDQIISFTGAGQVVNGELTARIAMAGSARDGALRKEDFQIFGDHAQINHLSYATSGHTGFEPTVTKGNLTVSSVAGQASVLSVVGGTGSVIGSGSLVKINKADTTHDGYISSTDWNTFNGKEPAVSKGNLTESTSSVLTISNGTGSVIGSGTTIQVKVAGTSQSGYLSSTDWNTFNGKQAALGYTAESTSNKSTTTTLGTSDTLYPTQNAVKTYADSKVTDTIADGVTTIAPSQNAVYDALAGKQASLGYTAENTANKSNDTALGSSTSYYPTQNAVKSYVDTGLSSKQASLGYTAENSANKSTNTSLGTSDTYYPSQNAVKSYVDTAVSTKITASSTDTLTNKTLSSTTNTIIITTRTINTQTGTTYTLVASDAGKIITLNNGSAIAVTIPQNSSVAFNIGTQIDCIQLGVGTVTFSGSGVTINSKGSNKSIGAQYVGCTLLKTDTDTWSLLGDLTS